MIVYGASHAVLQIANAHRVRVERVVLLSTPFLGGCPDAQYGVNVVSSTDGLHLNGAAFASSGMYNCLKNVRIGIDAVQATACY